MGFYDLRLPEVREQQAELAAEAGLDGFVYYHFWFNGKQLLERPINEILRLQEPRLPFCLAWANENWTRSWDGGNAQILVQQHYSIEDDLAHIRSMRPVLTDDRYITDKGRPILLIYRSSDLPNSLATTDLWRAEAQRWGLPDLYLLRVESFPSEQGDDPRPLGFDAAVQFQPNLWQLPKPSVRFRIREKIARARNTSFPSVVQYDLVAENAISDIVPAYPRWPGVTPGWDNSARVGNRATILLDSTPEVYGRWLRSALSKSRVVASTYAEGMSGLVFINAWNEWAEGNHLEPDLRYGKAFIDATRRAIEHDVSGVLSQGTQGLSASAIEKQ
jgi:lipopolysaccharide biosynthesis protein